MEGFVIAYLAPRHRGQGEKQGERKDFIFHRISPFHEFIQGEVWFNIEVDETGKIVSAEATGGDSLLIAASKEALQKSRFYPYVVNGTPVRVEAQLGFHFTIEKNGSSVSGRVDCITQGR
jgi:Gram-negative bacterial TonB protein C-terminal